MQLPNRFLEGIEIPHSRVGVKFVLADICFLLPLVHVVLFCLAIFKVCGLHTDNDSSTHIDILPYFAVG